MDLTSSTALVTGANRGFGRALVAELLRRGATVYAGVRNPDQIDLPGATPIALDITNRASVAAAAQAGQRRDRPDQQRRLRPRAPTC